MKKLKLKKILILLEKGVEDSEFIYPYYRFQEEGFKMDIVAPQAKRNTLSTRRVPLHVHMVVYGVYGQTHMGS